MQITSNKLESGPSFGDLRERIMHKRLRFEIFSLGLSLALALSAPAAAQEILPKPDAPFEGKIAETREQSTPAFPAPIKAPKGAPNVVLILLDDAGFAASSTFGGPAATPDLGKDTGSPVSPSYQSPFAFTGKVEKVEIDVKP